MSKARTGSRGQDVSRLLPLHHKVYLAVRQRLSEGVYASDRPLPGEHQLAAEFGVSRVTVRRTLAQLEEDGLVDRRHGVGTFPRPRKPVRRQTGKMATYYTDLRSAMVRYDDELLEFGFVPTPFETAPEERFGSVALKIVRRGCLKREVFHILRSYVAADVGKGITEASLGNRAMLDVLAREGWPAADFQLTLGAVAADAADARLLSVPVGAPLVQAIRRTYDKTGRLIEYNETLSRADRFAYRFAIDVATGRVRLEKRD